ncbi:unnamed protein product (macronuclear) [Paramecium tetraurelia]|uniref:Insulin-degrading enzyme n=1 Tax=Paramecium tetraurelia TaxID=5888 RepID=A0C9C8_PARTE|nr:uncharacterized protein GSPATT00006701001 [Paramecium tetraurelia]CAK67395.1 unnamed protein product [Paramecium tetraurelia]|eukprot:XP_001434792.1 hypothetical protein (macronuclear) [Paramecium tetraurelia strain d4-2]
MFSSLIQDQSKYSCFRGEVKHVCVDLIKTDQKKGIFNNDIKSEQIKMIHKSTIDKRTFKSVTLSNSLLCLLISDPETEKSAAALNVDVGSLEDPVDRMGLAHFCEHMLFMGTDKYPKENEYQQYISKNAGSTNAFTSELNTNFFFSVGNQALEGALDRFAQFFISPLFSDSCTEREMKAVDSEYNMNLQNDFWRKFQLFHNASLPGSQYNKFMIGNLKTLQFEDTRARLQEFHKRYYSSNVMKLVIYGSQPIETLEGWAQTYFEGIQNKNLAPPSYNVMPFDQTNMGQLIKYVPIKNQDHLELIYIIDYLYPHYRSCPGKYLSHLIGHEGENSLLSLLIKEDLAQELSAGPSNTMKLFSEMTIRIKLTQKGLQQYQKVIQYVQEYIELLKQKGPQEWIFKEISAIKKLEFDFLEKGDPFNYVCTLASRMQQYPIEDVLRQPYLMEQYQPELIQKITNQLTGDRLMMFLSSQTFSNQLGNKEEYFGTEYSQSKFLEDVTSVFKNAANNISPKLNLPPQNIYIPEHTNVLPLQNGLPLFPELVLQNEQTDLWFKQDDRFQVPKTVIQLRINTIETGYGKLAKTEAIAKIWLALLKNHVREFNYLAEMAKIDATLQLAANGLEFSISGFSDSISRFVIGMFQKIISFKPQDYQDLYESTFVKITQELENIKRSQPYQQVHSLMTVVLREGSSFETQELLDQLTNITFDDVIHFSNNFLKRCRFEWLIMGNLVKEEAIQIVQKSLDLFKAKTLRYEQVLQIRPVMLNETEICNYTYDLTEPTETNSGIVVHYQIGKPDLRTQLYNEILQTIMKTPFFSQLRTTEQLGYAVFSLLSDVRGIAGFTFLIQSNVKCPNYVQQRIRTFIKENLNKQITEMTEQDFEQFKSSVKVQLLEKDYSLIKESVRMWNEVQKHQRLFDRRVQQLNILDGIKLSEVQEYFKTHLIEKTKQFEIHAISPTHKKDQEEIKSDSLVYNSSDKFKKRHGLYPDYFYQ